MRFANYKFNARSVNNLGDNLQIIATDYIYQKMNISHDKIIYIDTHDLDKYRGEYVILPITMPLMDYQEGGIARRFSPYIIPVFIGLTILRESLSNEEIMYLKKYEPIGCRDERTLLILRKYNIQCYLHGCITITFPQRESFPEHPTTFIVDVNPKLLDKIPQKILQDARFPTHLRKEKLEDPKKEALKQYQEYIDNAGLVVTSLLHCAVPCIAAGIPVILIKERVSYRMGWLEKILPIYTKETMQDINWNPDSIDLSEHKDRVLEITIKRLRDVYAQNALLYDLSWFYENRKKNEYFLDSCDSIKCFIDENWKDFNKEYNYAIWGLTQVSEWVIDYIEERYPNARLTHIYDSFRKVSLHGLQSEDPENIKDSPMEIVFITTNGAEEAARKLFRKIQKPKNTYVFPQIKQ